MHTESQKDRHAFLRIRDEGDKVTLTYKQRKDYAASTIDSTSEIEVEVSDFDKAIEIFRLSDLPPVTYQETRRETWKLGDVEIVIDEWPWIDPFIEVEGASEEAVRRAVEQLGYQWSEVMICQIDQMYELQYLFAPGVYGLQAIRDIRFELPVAKELHPSSL